MLKYMYPRLQARPGLTTDNAQNQGRTSSLLSRVPSPTRMARKACSVTTRKLPAIGRWGRVAVIRLLDGSQTACSTVEAPCSGDIATLQASSFRSRSAGISANCIKHRGTNKHASIYGRKHNTSLRMSEETPRICFPAPVYSLPYVAPVTDTLAFRPTQRRLHGCLNWIGNDGAKVG